MRQQPDVIPTQRESNPPEIIETLPPPDAFSNGNNDHDHSTEIKPTEAIQIDEQIYSNINYVEEQQQQQHYDGNQVHAQSNDSNINTNEEQTVNSIALVGNEECDLSEYIEDTKVRAIALYDYQASAEDEISFDPNEIITHIEQVCLLFTLFK